MQKKACKIPKQVMYFFCVVLYAVFVFYNFLSNKEFWDASATNCISLGIALFVSYFFVQKQTDRRKQKDIVLMLLQDLQRLVWQKHTYDFTGLSKEEITMTSRHLSSKIHLLEEMKDEFYIANEIDFIRSKYDEYNSFIGDNIENYEYLLQSQKALRRPIELIENKLCETMLKLYQ